MRRWRGKILNTALALCCIGATLAGCSSSTDSEGAESTSTKLEGKLPGTVGFCDQKCDDVCFKELTAKGLEPDIVSKTCCREACELPPEHCLDLCDTDCILNATQGVMLDEKEQPVDAKGGVIVPGPEILARCCMGQCLPPAPTCESRCDDLCIKDQITRGIAPDKAMQVCCKDALCPLPPPPVCEPGCDKDCFGAAQAKGLAPGEVVKACCQAECLPPQPELPPVCDPVCIKGMTTKGADPDLVFKTCCKNEIQPEPPLCEPLCNDKCIEDMLKQNVSKDAVLKACCSQDCTQPPAPFEDVCDKSCFEQAVQAGLSKDEAFVKCCRPMDPGK